MVDPITTTLASLKGAYEGTKTVLKLGVSTAIQKQVFELQAQILAAQESAVAANTTQADLLKRVSELEAQVASFEDWKAEAERYELLKLPPGTYVRSLKKDAMKDGEPEHYLCAACFENRKKGFLHERPAGRGQTRLTCSECDKEVVLGHAQPIEVMRRGPRAP